MRYLIDGCYGDGNVGDECLLQASIDLVRQADPAAQIAVLSSDAPRTADETGLPALPQCNPFGRNIYGALCKGLLWQTVKAIRQCDVFILGGGELFRDDVGPTATLGMFYRLHLARTLGKRVVVWGVGAQPATTWWGTHVLRQALQDADALAFRDPDSLQVARHLAPRLADARSLPDLVFSLDWDPLTRLKCPENLGGKIDLGIAVKSLPSCHRHAECVKGLLPELITQAITSVAEREPFRIHLLPFADGDRVTAEEWRTRLVERGLEVVSVADPEIESLRQRVARLDALIAVPLHASVFAFACGVPALALAYDAKVPRLYNSFDCADMCQNVTELDATTVRQALTRLIAQRVERGGMLLAQARAARQLLRGELLPMLTAAQEFSVAS